MALNQKLLKMLLLICLKQPGEHSKDDADTLESLLDHKCFDDRLTEYVWIRDHNYTVAALKNDWPLSVVTEKDGKLVGEGVAFQFLELLQKKFGFNYKIKTPELDIIGDRKSGIIGMLTRKEVDFAAAFVPVYDDYHDVLDYSVNIGEDRFAILMKRPLDSATGSGLLAPFQAEVWYLILLFLILMGPVVYFIILVRVKLCKGSVRLTRIFPLSSCIWFVYGALLKQGSTLNPITDSSRLLFATWWIFITILTSFYTANLTAFLTLSQFTLPIDTAKDVARKRMTWLVRKGGPMEHVVTSEPEFDYLNVSLARYGMFSDKSDPDLMTYEIFKKGRVFFRENRIIQDLLWRDYLNKTRNNITETKRCTFVATPKPFMSKPLAFAYPKGSDLPPLFNPILRSLMEAGIVEFKLHEMLPGPSICPLNLGQKERKLRNSDLFTTYVVVCGGFASALIAFLGELTIRLINYCKGKDGKGPPPYSKEDMLFNPKSHMVYGMGADLESGADFRAKQSINGRDYFVINGSDGNKRLIPVRTPSAFLFQYSG